LAFTKEERLKSKRIIDALFINGRAITIHPLKVFWNEVELPAPVPLQIGFSVPKRVFKSAVQRNRIKRQMREAVRLNKGDLEQSLGIKNRQLALMVLYIGRDVTEYKLIEQKIREAFDRLIKS
jgi:ribonuclease P protein component